MDLRQGKAVGMQIICGLDSLFATYRLASHFGKIVVEYYASGVKVFAHYLTPLFCRAFRTVAGSVQPLSDLKSAYSLSLTSATEAAISPYRADRRAQGPGPRTACTAFFTAQPTRAVLSGTLRTE